MKESNLLENVKTITQRKKKVIFKDFMISNILSRKTCQSEKIKLFKYTIYYYYYVIIDVLLFKLVWLRYIVNRLAIYLILFFNLETH